MKATLTPRQRYGRIVRKVGAEYGLTEPPRASFGKTDLPGAEAVTTLSENEAPIIRFGRGVTDQLKSRDPKARREARHTVLWELGRTIQGDRGDPWLMHKTNKTSRQLNKQQARDRKRHLWRYQSR